MVTCGKWGYVQQKTRSSPYRAGGLAPGVSLLLPTLVTTLAIAEG